MTQRIKKMIDKLTDPTFLEKVIAMTGPFILQTVICRFAPDLCALPLFKRPEPLDGFDFSKELEACRQDQLKYGFIAPEANPPSGGPDLSDLSTWNTKPTG